MKVTMLKTGKTVSFYDEYAQRLIEQGLAVIAGDEPEGLKKAEAEAGKAKATEEGATDKGAELEKAEAEAEKVEATEEGATEKGATDKGAEPEKAKAGNKAGKKK